MSLAVQQTHPVDALVEQKTADCLKLRIRGYSYRKIADETGISRSMAHMYVVQALAELREQNAESATELRQIEATRCDAMIRQLWPDTPGATLDARTADTILRISERRSKLFGLDTVNAPPAANLAGEIVIRVLRDADVLPPAPSPST